MDAGKRTINEIFTGTMMLEVPFFQRAYVWGRPQWERFLEDIEIVCGTKRPYFMGALILKQELTSSNATIGNVRLVIDGQQRLTTLSIMLKVLCLKTGAGKKYEKRFILDDGTPVLQHNHNDVEAYNKVINLDELKDVEGDDNLTRAYRFFMENVDPDKIDFDAVCNLILFVGIDLNHDEDEQQIFDTINSLGVTLTTAELLKNYFFGRNEYTDYMEYWLKVFESDEETREYWDQKITTGRLKRTLIDLFFFAYLQIKIQDSNLKVSADDKTLYSKADRLFDSYKNFVAKYMGNDKRAIYQEVKDYARCFRKSIDPSYIDRELPADAGLERINALMFALDTTTLIPYVLFLEHEVAYSETRNQMYAFIESYIMRRLVTRETTKNYNHLFTDNLILNRVRTAEHLRSYFAGQEDSTARMPSDDEVKLAFHESVLTNKYAAGVLYFIESKIRDRAKHSTALLGIDKYSLEHMMPKKWRNNWEFSGDSHAGELRDRVILTLGNLAIITQSLNASIRDADWSTKKAGKGDKGGLIKYADGIETLQKYLARQQWDEEAISNRANDLSMLAVQIWSK